MKKRRIMLGFLALLIAFSIMPARPAMAAKRNLKVNTKRQDYSLGKVAYRDLVNVTWAKRAGYSKKAFKGVKSLVVKRSAYDLSSKKTVRASFKLKKTRRSLKDTKFTSGRRYKNIKYTLYAKKKNGKLVKLASKKIRTKKPKKFVRRWRGKNMPTTVRKLQYTVHDTMVDRVVGKDWYRNESKNGRFVRLDFTVKNVAKQSQDDYNNDYYLVDKNNKRYRLTTLIGQDYYLHTDGMLPGESFNSIMVFDVPKWVAEGKSTKLRISTVEYDKDYNRKVRVGYIYINR